MIHICFTVGASVTVPDELRFLYENHENYDILPTFFIMPGMQAVMSSAITTSAVPGKSITLDQVLHGEHYLEILHQPPQEGTLTSKLKLVEVLDKGSGAAIAVDGESKNYFFFSSKYQKLIVVILALPNATVCIAPV